MVLYLSGTLEPFIISPYFPSLRLAGLRVDLLPPRRYSPKQATYKDGTPRSLPSINIRSRRFRTNKYQLITSAVDVRLKIIYVFLLLRGRFAYVSMDLPLPSVQCYYKHHVSLSRSIISISYIFISVNGWNRK